MAKKLEAPESLEAKIQECAKQCGLTPDDAHSVVAGVGDPTRAIGDGVLFGKFLDFIKLVLPILLPLILKQEPPA